jgi:hypothetical protein
MSPQARMVDERLLRSLKAGLHRVRLDDPAISTSLLCLCSAVSVLGSWWYFQDLLAAMLDNISTTDARNLRLLSPDNVYWHDLYREVFVYVSAGAGAVWFIVAKVTPKNRDTHHMAIWWGAAALFVLALGLLEFPYRVLRDTKFDAVTLSGADCYKLAERSDEALVFCPDMPAPRTRIVKKTVGLEPAGRHESIFTRFH